MMKKVIAAGLPRHRALTSTEIWRRRYDPPNSFFIILLGLRLHNFQNLICPDVGELLPNSTSRTFAVEGTLKS